MYDPMSVAFDIPSYRMRQRWPWLPMLVTVWHVDPEHNGNDDSCGETYRWRKLSARDNAINEVMWDGETIFDNRPHWSREGGTPEHRWFQELKAAWMEHKRRRTFWRIAKRWHFWHWSFQVHPINAIRRRLLSKCEVCGKGFKKGDGVLSTCWNGPLPRWFEMLRGERGLAHDRCMNSRVNRQASVATTE